ncbi:MAG TPA: hypothetical protein VNG90_05170 [Candidatus Acidoferrum sp.]|nr:hypothetical protein [Candidatus Acidoferrum sp.]
MEFYVADHIDSAAKKLATYRVSTPALWGKHRSTDLESMLIQIAVKNGPFDDEGRVKPKAFEPAGLHLTKQLYELNEQRDRTVPEVVYMLWLQTLAIEVRPIAIALKIDGVRVEFLIDGTARVEDPSGPRSWPFSFTPAAGSMLAKVAQICAQVDRVLRQVKQCLEAFAWKLSPIGTQLAITKALYIQDCLEHGVQVQTNRASEATTCTAGLDLASQDGFDDDAPATAIYRWWLREVGVLPPDYTIIRHLNNGYGTLLNFLQDRKILIQEGDAEAAWPFNVDAPPSADFQVFSTACEQAVRVFTQAEKIFAALFWNAPQPVSAVIFEVVQALYILDCTKHNRPVILARRV